MVGLKTVIGSRWLIKHSQPMTWQKADAEFSGSETHIPLSRCSSVIALSLGGDPVSQVRNKGRRVDRKTGDVFDPFAPWRVLSIQAYPDWKSSINSHNSTKHYVNGPEAFLVTLKAEFEDAQKRLLEVYNRICDLVRTPVRLYSGFFFRKSVVWSKLEFFTAKALTVCKVEFYVQPSRERQIVVRR